MARISSTGSVQLQYHHTKQEGTVTLPSNVWSRTSAVYRLLAGQCGPPAQLQVAVGNAWERMKWAAAQEEVFPSGKHVYLLDFSIKGRN